MLESIDVGLVDWSRAQFALTAMYHWLFVPLTLGTTFIIAIMESIYVKTGNEEWKRMTKFWMTLFGINFAIGVATGIILEFEFGTNWSNYSFFVGDIFGAPLAIEGIMAFFMESTFIAVMFFGWNKVSKKFHLVSSWMVAIGANLSALWILVANAWMQSPVGMQFNPDTARNEMTSFWEVLFSPVAINKFLHTISSSYMLSAIFVIGVSAWFLLKKKHIKMAKKSILVASIFGIVATVSTIGTGDGSAKQLARVQPVKLAAMEGLYEGKEGVGLIAIGAFKNTSVDPDYEMFKEFMFKIEIPKFLSILSYGDEDAYVAGLKDLVDGNEEHGIISVPEKMARGKVAIEKLKNYKAAKKSGSEPEVALLRAELMSKNFQDNYFKYLGYGHLKNKKDVIPNIQLLFYTFHSMVAIGFLLLMVFILAIYWVLKDKIQNFKWFLWLAIIAIPLAYIASQFGWMVAEFGRQPWVIQDLMTTGTAVSKISSGSVQITFWMFAIIFTGLLIAEIKIMLKQIKIGPHE